MPHQTAHWQLPPGENPLTPARHLPTVMPNWRARFHPGQGTPWKASLQFRSWRAGFHPGPCSGAAASHRTPRAAATRNGASEVAQVSNAPLPQNSEKSLCLTYVQESSRNKPRRSACMAGGGFSHAARRQASGVARGWNNSASFPMNPSKALPQDATDARPLQGWSVLRRWRLNPYRQG